MKGELSPETRARIELRLVELDAQINDAENSVAHESLPPWYDGLIRDRNAGRELLYGVSGDIPPSMQGITTLNQDLAMCDRFSGEATVPHSVMASQINAAVLTVERAKDRIIGELESSQIMLRGVLASIVIAYDWDQRNNDPASLDSAIAGARTMLLPWRLSATAPRVYPTKAETDKMSASTRGLFHAPDEARAGLASERSKDHMITNLREEIAAQRRVIEALGGNTTTQTEAGAVRGEKPNEDQAGIAG